VFAVIGHPVGHSLSPGMQNAALVSLGMDAVYVAFDVEPQRLGAALDGLEALGAAGVNVTIPFKERVIAHLSRLSPEAELIGAVNTVAFVDGERRGFNTDAPGFLRSLTEAGGRPGPTLLLGAGGSARAVAVALTREGAELTIANRTHERAVTLAAMLNTRVRNGCAQAIPWEPMALRSAMGEVALLVNTTSVGMHPRTEACPEIPEEGLHAGLLVYDLIYNPSETRLLAWARARGCRTVNGARMLAWQGALALEIWTGRAGPADLMEAALIAQLKSATPPQANGGV
jgi:shikimate dehydrogenase